MNKISDLLIRPDEKVISYLGNSSLQNILSSGIVGNNYLILSNTRLYYRGKRSVHGISMCEEDVVDLKDITGSGFRHFKPVLLLYIGILLAIAGVGVLLFRDKIFGGYFRQKFNPVLIAIFIFAAIFLGLYFLGKRTFFFVEFGGGSLATNMKLISRSEAAAFQIVLRRCKEAAETGSEVVSFSSVPTHVPAPDPAPVPPVVQITGSDGTENMSPENKVILERFRNLYESGIITQEQFEAKKNKLMNK